jgi:hypothetical protein
MAKSKVQTTITTTLTLSEAEAQWLRALLQNPLPRINEDGMLAYPDEPEEEDEYSRSMRHSLFDALTSPGSFDS